MLRYCSISVNLNSLYIKEKKCIEKERGEIKTRKKINGKGKPMRGK